MDTSNRTVVTNPQNYKEVSQTYRRYRSSKLRLNPPRENRLHCPMLDASLSDQAYGEKALRGTSKKDIIEWANAISAGKQTAFLLIAYLSGPLKELPGNVINGRFDADKVNSGFITQIKDRINTGILDKGVFDQHEFDSLICKIHPELKGKTLNEDVLYSDAFADCYITGSNLAQILSHNLSHKAKGGFRKFIGKAISKFEMESLLLGILAQPITPNEGDSSSAVNAMLVRDLFDLYKYGWLPAHIEDNFIKAGVLKIVTNSIQ